MTIDLVASNSPEYWADKYREARAEVERLREPLSAGARAALEQTIEELTAELERLRERVAKLERFITGQGYDLEDV